MSNDTPSSNTPHSFTSLAFSIYMQYISIRLSLSVHPLLNAATFNGYDHYGNGRIDGKYTKFRLKITKSADDKPHPKRYRKRPPARKAAEYVVSLAGYLSCDLPKRSSSLPAALSSSNFLLRASTICIVISIAGLPMRMVLVALFWLSIRS